MSKSSLELYTIIIRPSILILCLIIPFVIIILPSITIFKVNPFIKIEKDSNCTDTIVMNFLNGTVLINKLDKSYQQWVKYMIRYEININCNECNNNRKSNIQRTTLIEMSKNFDIDSCNFYNLSKTEYNTTQDSNTDCNNQDNNILDISKDNIINEKDNIINEKDNIINEKDNIIKELTNKKDNIINKKDNIIKELTNKKDNIIKELTNKIKLLEIENNELKCKNKIHHNIEYIYIIHPIQCINTNIYKIGRSNNIINRHKQYPKGSELLFSISCKKSKILEQNILNFLKDNSNYIQIKKYGNEYFQCNLEMLINDIHNIVQN